MKLRQLFENKVNTVGIIFGRFNPPHQGHKAAWEMLAQNDIWYVGTNKSTIGPKDPLPFDVKIEAMTAVWPDVADHIVAETSWLTMASKVWNEYGEVNLVCYTDEAWVTNVIRQYNGKEGAHGYYKFPEVIKEATPRLSSATALRDAVANDDRDAFTKAAGVPADTNVGGTPYFDLVAEYLLPYAEKAKKKKQVAETTETVSVNEAEERRVQSNGTLTNFNIDRNKPKTVWTNAKGEEKIIYATPDEIKLAQSSGGLNGFSEKKAVPEIPVGKDGNPDWSKVDASVKYGTVNGVGVERPPAPTAAELDQKDYEMGMQDPNQNPNLKVDPKSGVTTQPASKPAAKTEPKPLAAEPTANDPKAAAPAAAPAASGQVYKIKPGDNLTKIAKANGTTVDAIMKANPQIKDPNKIFAGQDLNIPANNVPADAQPPAQDNAQTPADAQNNAQTPAPAPQEPAKPAAPAVDPKSLDITMDMAKGSQQWAELVKANGGDEREAFIDYRQGVRSGEIPAPQPTAAPAVDNTAPIDPDAELAKDTPQPNSTIGKAVTGGDTTAQPNADGTVNSTANAQTGGGPNADGTVSSTSTSTDGDTATDTSNTKTTTQQGGEKTVTKTNVPDYTPDQQKADELAATNAEIDAEIADAKAAGDTAKVAELEKEKAAFNSQGPNDDVAAGIKSGGVSVDGAKTTPTDSAEAPAQVAAGAGEPTQTYTPQEQDAAAKEIEELLKKANLQENVYYNKLAILLNEHSVLKEALTPEEIKRLQDLLKKVQGNEKYKDLVARANKVVPPSAADEKQVSKDLATGKDAQAQDDDVEDYDNKNRTYTVDGKPASKEEYAKAFGYDASMKHGDYQQIHDDIEKLAQKVETDKQKLTQQWLNDKSSPYYDGVPIFPEDPDYPPEFKKIDDDAKKQTEKLQKQAAKLAKDPEVKKLIDNGGDDFDRLLSGDDDVFDKLFASDQEDAVDKGNAGTKGGEETTTSWSDEKVSTNDNGNTSSSSVSTSSVRTTGGKSTTVKKTGGDVTINFSARYKETPESTKLRAEAKQVRKDKIAAAKEWDKKNPGQRRFAFFQTPEAKEFDKKEQELKTQAREARELRYPGGEVKNGKTTYYDPKTGKEIQWDGEQFDPEKRKPMKDRKKEETQESVELHRIKFLSGLAK